MHIVLDDFGQKLGRAYRETDEGAADEVSIVENILNGEYSHPLRVVAFNVAEGWARDVSDEIANRLLDLSAKDRMLSASAREFVERVHWAGSDGRCVKRGGNAGNDHGPPSHAALNAAIACSRLAA